MSNSSYENKYLKYKAKYENLLQTQVGGADGDIHATVEINLDGNDFTGKQSVAGNNKGTINKDSVVKPDSLIFTNDADKKKIFFKPAGTTEYYMFDIGDFQYQDFNGKSSSLDEEEIKLYNIEHQVVILKQADLIDGIVGKRRAVPSAFNAIYDKNFNPLETQARAEYQQQLISAGLGAAGHGAALGPVVNAAASVAIASSVLDIIASVTAPYDAKVYGPVLDKVKHIAKLLVAKNLAEEVAELAEVKKQYNELKKDITARLSSIDLELSKVDIDSVITELK